MHHPLHYLLIYLVGWSLTSLFSTNTAISETNLISDNYTCRYNSVKELSNCGDGRSCHSSGPKSGGCYASFRGGAGSPSNTMWPGPRPISVPGGNLSHPTVWPQYTNVTDRQERQRSDIATEHRANRFTNGLPKIILLRY